MILFESLFKGNIISNLQPEGKTDTGNVEEIELFELDPKFIKGCMLSTIPY